MFGRAKADSGTARGTVIVHVPAIKRLPPPAAAKLIAIQDAWRDANGMAVGAGNARNEAAADWRAEMRDFEHQKRLGFASRPDHDRAEARVNELKELMERANARLGRLQEASNIARTLKQNIERWVDAIPPAVVFKEANAVAAKVQKGESTSDAIARCRRMAQELRNKARDIRTAPITSAEAKQILRRYVTLLSEVGQPDLQYVLEAGRSRIDWPSERLNEVAHQFGLGQYRQPDPLPAVAFAAWFDADRLYDRLCQQVEAEADDTIAIPASDRLKKSLIIAAEKLAVEREEESLITQAADDGASIARRVDADPRAVLQLHSDMPAPVED